MDAARRVLGVIRPTAESVGALTQSRHVGVVATPGTIKSHTYNIYKKVDVHSRKELINLIKDMDEDDQKPRRAKKATRS